jgi:mono/diheme cytochrome c family protein
MKSMLVVVPGAAALVAAALLFDSGAAGQPAETERGRKLFVKHCSICHGQEGAGDGSAAYLLHPKPRDFRRGEFRLITTDNSVPTDDDLFRVITNGMPGSAMPPWDRLAEADRRLLVDEVKRLWIQAVRKRLQEDPDVEREEVEEYLEEDTTPGKTISFEGETEPTQAEIARGRIVYFRACAPCHGQEGRGETTQQLLDSRGFPAPARDYTKGIFKGGSEARQLYARLRSGMKGTAMPTYEVGGLSNEEAWSVVHYIRTLFPPGAQERQEQRMQQLTVRRMDKLPATEQEWWRAAPAAYVALMPLWWRDRRIEGVLFQGAHDGKTLMLRLAWEDLTQNDSQLRHEDFHDGAAVQLSSAADPPFFGMGDESGSVLIWSWKASWQEDQAGYRDLESIYPKMHLDTYYPVQKNLKAGERPDPKAVGAPHHDPRFLSGWGAGNPMSNPERPSAVEVVRAKGQGTLTSQEREVQTVRGKAVWDRGIWTLEIKVELTRERSEDRFIAFAVWDGTQGDRNGQKSVSIWHRLELEK